MKMSLTCAIIKVCRICIEMKAKAFALQQNNYFVSMLLIYKITYMIRERVINELKLNKEFIIKTEKRQSIKSVAKSRF